MPITFADNTGIAVSSVATDMGYPLSESLEYDNIQNYDCDFSYDGIGLVYQITDSLGGVGIPFADQSSVA